MNMVNKLASGFIPKASNFTLQASCCELLAMSLRLTLNKLVACSLWLVAIIGLQTATAQSSFPPVTINLSYPQYQSLKLDGGFMYINDAGIQGVILYRVNETTYVAFERKCSISDDAPVSVDGSSLFMKGCNATYSFSDGYPTSGQTTQPLLKYRTSLTGQTLVITDEVAY
jgi:hypothetical protein